MTVRRTFLTVLVIVGMFLLYLLVQPLGPGYEQLDRTSYSVKTEGVHADNKWSRFDDDKKGGFFVHPGQEQPVTIKLKFAHSGDAMLSFSIKEGSKSGDIKFTVKHNTQYVGAYEVTYAQPEATAVLLTIEADDLVVIEVDKNGTTDYDWGQVKVEQRSGTFTLQAFLTPLLWALLAFFLASKRHLSIVINAYLIFIIYIVAEKITFGPLDFKGISAYNALAISLTFIFVWIYQELYWARRYRVASVFSLLVALVIYIIPITCIVYYLNFNESVDKTILFAVFQTNAAETLEYINDFISLKWSLLYVAITLVMGILMLSHEERIPVRFERFLLMFLIVAFAIPTLIAADALRLPHFTYQAAVEYHSELSAFKAIQKRRQAGLEEDLIAHKAQTDETHVVVIGESLNKRHMGLYGYFRDTTPFLSDLRRNGELLVYQNAFSNHTHTMQVMSQALTQANQFNNRSYYDSPSIVDVLKSANVETIWITNQNLLGAWDNMVSVIASSADKLVGLNRAIGTTITANALDANLLPDIEKAIKKRVNKTKVIFVHLMGSHSNYCSRFPAEYALFNETLSRGMLGSSVAKQPNLINSVNCYDNSVLYNDYVVSSIISRLRDQGGIGSLVYFSDHGDDVIAQLGHNSAKFTFEMTAVPLMFWLSEAYAERYPNKQKYLANNIERLFTNDFLFDTFIGLFDIQSDQGENRFDLSSAKYDLDVSKVHTLYGDKPLLSDSNYIWWHRQNLSDLSNMQQERRVIPHRVNSIGKLRDIWATGYRSFEVDIIFRADDKGFFQVGHDEATAGERFDVFLDSVDSSAIEKIWFDLKNLNESNYPAVLKALEELDSQYALKERIILESGTTQEWFKIFGDSGWRTSYYAPTGKMIEMLANNDTSGMHLLADAIAAQIKSQNVSAISFDHRGYPFIKEYLEAKLAPHIVYHSWLGPTISSGRFMELLKQTPIYADERVQTILVTFQSPFHL